MTKLIAPEYLKEFLFHEMALNDENTQGCEIISLNRLLYGDTELPSESYLLLKLSKLVQSRKEEFPGYEKMVSFPSFYREILSFASELSLYGISADELPAEDENERQLKEIIRLALSLEPAGKPESTAAVIEKARSGNMKAVSSFESSLFRYRIMKEIREASIPFRILCDAKPKGIQRRHALTPMKEIEACAQYICRNEKPCTVVLCNPSSQMPALQQVFARYGIPFSYTADSYTPSIGHCFRMLAEFAVYPDSSHLIRVLETEALACTCDEDLLSFLRQTLDGIHAPDRADAYRAAYEADSTHKYDPMKALGRDPVSLYTKMEKRAQEYFSLIQETVDSLSSCTDAKQKLIRSYNALTHSGLLANPDEMAAGRAILSILQDCAESAENDDDVIFLAKLAEDITVSSSRLVSDFCTVTDIRHPVPVKENTYVLGCDAKSWPGFSAMSGLFDETYVRRVRGFPALEERQKAYEEQLKWIESSCENELVFSYASNDYLGREQVPAYELEKYGQSSRWQTVSLDLKRSYEHGIDQETAAKLFCRTDDEGRPYIRGSISSAETWFRCPYRYFIASGLYVRKPQTPSLSPDFIGTFQHAVLENAVFRDDGSPNKDYAAELNEETVRSLLSPWFTALRIANPHETEKIGLSMDRMVNSLMRSAQFLAAYEKSSSYIPKETEKEFRNYHVSDHVLLNGTIDRISCDPANHMFEVIDYKSSSHSLSEKNVASGQQLQLLTYLLAAYDLYESENGNEPAGAYYFSLTGDDITDMKKVKAASVNRSSWKLSGNPLRDDEETGRKLMISERKLTGWTFTDRKDTVDSEGIYVSNLKKTYDRDLVRECLCCLYEYFYNSLIGNNDSGTPDIRISPVEKVCDWCDYHDICRFHGEPRTPDVLYEGSFAKEKVK